MHAPIIKPAVEDLPWTRDLLTDLPATGPYATLRLGPRDCRWPMSDPGSPEFRFCCAPQLRRKQPRAKDGAEFYPYCREHSARAFELKGQSL